jgi:hypothetical protein
MRPEDSPKLNIEHSTIRYVLLRKFTGTDVVDKYELVDVASPRSFPAFLIQRYCKGKALFETPG